MRWLRTRTAVRSLVPIGVLATSLVLACAGPGPDASVAPIAAATRLDRNVKRARATFITIEQDFRTEHDLFLEIYPSSADAYATLWPLTQLIAGDLAVSRLLGQISTPASLPAFEPYWDAAVSPPGYSASTQPPLGSGDRKFFDDNAWTGLAQVQAYRLSGNQAALARARQVFDFTVSGWDSDPTHPDQGGVWWSQQMPNPRFRPSQHGLDGFERRARLAVVRGERPDRGVRPGLGNAHVHLGRYVFAWHQWAVRGPRGPRRGRRPRPTHLQPGHDDRGGLLRDVFGPDFNQQPAYNAVFFRNLLLLESETGDERYRAAMQAYADQIWDTLRDPATGLFNFAYGRSRSIAPHRLVDQAAMLQIYALLALGPSAAANIT